LLEDFMQAVLQDLHFSLRQLRTSPGFAAVAVLSLALGIGATTAVFSVVYAVLMDPYPYAASDRMVHLVVKDNGGADNWIELTGPQLRELAKAKSIESIAGFTEWNLTTTGGELPEDVTAIYFTGNAFNHFGVPTFLGRGLLRSDSPEGQDPENVAVLGYQFWQRHYNGDPSMIGKTIQLSHKTYAIVGITPPRFTWGDGDAYIPWKSTNDPTRTLVPQIRLKLGVTRAAANAEFQAYLEQFAKETPKHFPEHFKVAVQGLNDHFLERLGGSLYLLFGAVVFLLLIGCGNVSILLLARGTARQHEIAVRSAIGAARSRLIAQLLTEALLLSFTGTLLGVGLGYGLLKLIVDWLPQFSFPHEAAIKMNLPVMLFSVGLALLTGVVFGIAPALQFSRPNIGEIMQSSTRKTTAGVKGRRIHTALIAGQMALTMVMLVAAAGAMQAFVRLMHVPLGYDPHNVMSVGIPVHENTYTTWQSRATYFEQLRQKVGTLPEVEMTGLSTNATPPNNGWEMRFEISGQPVVEQQRSRLNFVSPEYFPVLRIPMLQGRIFDDAETARGARVMVVGQTFAQKYFPNRDAIGHMIRLPEMKPEPPFQLAPPDTEPVFEVIGIAADLQDDGLGKPIKPQFYVPYTALMPVFTQILVRSRVEPLSILHDVRKQVLSVDADQQTFRQVQSLEEWITTQPEYGREHLIAFLFAGFGLLALTLAAAGLYSVVSYSVAQRTGEFGIRIALGALKKDVLLMVFRSAASSVGSGVLGGLILALGFNRLLTRWIEGISRNPTTLLVVTVLLFATAALACLVPALRASAVDPMEALRYE
jgi:putative ABC transport system permease protein